MERTEESYPICFSGLCKIKENLVTKLKMCISVDDFMKTKIQVFDERQRRMEEAAMLERHIMQAQARAMSADERELNKASQTCDNYGELGLPPGTVYTGRGGGHR